MCAWRGERNQFHLNAPLQFYRASKDVLITYFVGQNTMTTTNVQDDYRGSSRAGTIAMAVLGVMFVILRFLARWKKSLKPGLDDFTILGALVPFLALVGLMLACMSHFSWGFLIRWLIVNSK
jgi:hypothetical protein